MVSTPNCQQAGSFLEPSVRLHRLALAMRRTFRRTSFEEKKASVEFSSSPPSRKELRTSARFLIRSLQTMELTESIEVVKPLKREEKLTRVLLLATVVASFGSFQCGYTLWMVNNPAAILLEFPNSTFEKRPVVVRFREKLLGRTIIVFPIGGFLGALFIGFLVDRCGRKGALMTNNCLNIFAATFMGLSKVVHTSQFALFARFVNGISSGIFSCIVPLYIGEISPPNLRGSLYMVSMFGLTFGILVAQLLSLREALGTSGGLALLMSLTGIMASFNIILLYYIPESPRFLFIQQHNVDAARQALIELRENENVEEELEEMHQEDLFEKDRKNMNMITLLDSPEIRKSVLCTVVLMAGNQLTGVNGVYLYAERIYISLGLEGRHIRYMLIVVNSVIHVVILVMIAAIDSVGRRFLLLMGFLICSMVCILLAVSLEVQVYGGIVVAYFSTFFSITFIIGHMSGPGPIPYLITGELFLQSARGSAYVIGGFMNWFARFIVSVLYVFIEPKIGPYSLLIFWPVCITIFIYVIKMVPETMGKTFLEIQKGMETHKRQRRKSDHKSDHKADHKADHKSDHKSDHKRLKSEHKKPK